MIGACYRKNSADTEVFIGKTGLVCRVIRELENSAHTASRIAFFFCSNDKAHADHQGVSKSDPDEALRCIVSQVSTSKENNTVAPILQGKFDTLGPNTDLAANLPAADCVEILVTVAENVPITIIIDAFDELDQAKSPRLLQYLQETIRRSQFNVRIFVSTRAFTAIEDQLVTDRSIEVTAANNGSDVRTFIKVSITDRILDKTLLSGEGEYLHQLSCSLNLSPVCSLSYYDKAFRPYANTKYMQYPMT